MDGIGGYQAWRWIFIVEGLCTIVLGAASFPFLPAWPEQVYSVDDLSHQQSSVSEMSKYFIVKHGNTKAILAIIIRNPLVYFR